GDACRALIAVASCLRAGEPGGVRSTCSSGEVRRSQRAPDGGQRNRRLGGSIEIGARRLEAARARLLEKHSRRRGGHGTPKIRRAAQAPLRQHVLLRLRERRKKRGDGRVELRLERIGGRDEGGVVGLER